MMVGGTALAASTPTFYLSGRIDESSPEYLDEFLRENKGPVEILINTPGGDMQASLQIGAMLAARKGDITCRVRKIAASGGFFALQNCAVRIASSNSLIVTHEPRRYMGELMTRDEIVKSWQELTIDAENWNRLNRTRLKVTPAEYEEKVRGKDWIMNAQQALRVGAIDKIEN